MNQSATIVYNREKDQHSATGQWFSELVQKNPWYKDVVDDVSHTHTLPQEEGITITLC